MATILTFLDNLWERPLRARLSWFTIAVVVIVIGIFVQNLMLLRQNQQLRDRFDQGANREINPGEKFSGISGVDLQKEYLEVDFSSSKKGTLLISFSAGCGACHANVKNWINLSTHLNLQDWRIIWVSRDPLGMTKEFCSKEGVRGQVLSEVSINNYNLLALGTVPKTMVVDREGKVEKIWAGRLNEKAWSEIYEYFSLDPILISQF
jgi:peroxiredoxin